jgi:pSer/pThr/pTyr-binding forkhead associated (FHA) protein
MLRLTYGSESAICSVDHRSVLIGRDPSCGLVTATAFASRRHCTIFVAADGLKIRDHSSLGTFLVNEGSEEIQLADGQEVALGTHGWISLGCARAYASRLLEFSGQ